jgi:hypothetical protein
MELPRLAARLTGVYGTVCIRHFWYDLFKATVVGLAVFSVPQPLVVWLRNILLQRSAAFGRVASWLSVCVFDQALMISFAFRAKKNSAAPALRVNPLRLSAVLSRKWSLLLKMSNSELHSTRGTVLRSVEGERCFAELSKASR